VLFHRLSGHRLGLAAVESAASLPSFLQRIYKHALLLRIPVIVIGHSGRR
jgi:hypothetical protein